MSIKDTFSNVTSRIASSVTGSMSHDKLDCMTNWSSNDSGQMCRSSISKMSVGSGVISLLLSGQN